MSTQALQSSPEPQGVVIETLTRERLDLLKRTIAAGTTDDEFQLFLEACRRRRFDPFSKLIYPVKRYDSKQRREVMALQSSIDSFRLIADRSKEYAGQLGPFWCGPDGAWRDVWLEDDPPAAAKVGVLRHGFKEPLWAIARWRDYVQTDREGNATSFWRRMGPVMIAKCAEALGLRRAFPEDLAGLYTSDEMHHATNEAPPAREVTAEPTEPPKALSAPKRGLDALVKPAVTPQAIQQAASSLATHEKNELVETLAAQLEAGEKLDMQTGEVLPPLTSGEPRTLEEAGERLQAAIAARAAISPPTTATWRAKKDRTLEVTFPVTCGFWETWCNEKIPGSKLADRAPTWKEASDGKIGGGRHALLLDLVMKGYKLPFSEITKNHERAACTLAVMVAKNEAAEKDPTPKNAPKGEPVQLTLPT